MHSDPHAKDVVTRVFQPEDQVACLVLFYEGMLGGEIDPYDTASDVENIAQVYLADPMDRFWVAQSQDQIIGMIGVAHDDRHTAEIRRLRVHKDWQQTDLPAHLLQTALGHCRHCGYLKVLFDTRFEKDAALDLFTTFGFQFTRTKNAHGKDLLEFYVDLYNRMRGE